jgi:hypothetical protein
MCLAGRDPGDIQANLVDSRSAAAEHGAHMDMAGLVTRPITLGYIDPVEKSGVCKGPGECETRSQEGLRPPDEPEVSICPGSQRGIGQNAMEPAAAESSYLGW